jgi:non-ribosomal peptide synthetase component F
MRLALFQTKPDTYQFVWTVHHILMDGWGRALLLKEALTTYQGLCTGNRIELLPAPPYKDYVTWFRQQDLDAAERFWRQSLQGFTQTTPPGIVEPCEQWAEQEEVYNMLSQTLLPAATEALQKQAMRHRITVNTLLQGVWATVLKCYSGCNDVVFGITLAGRPADLSGIENMVGLCINTLPIRVQFSQERSLWTWLQHLQEYNLAIRQFEYCPTGLIHQWSEVAGASRLYETLLVVENYPLDLSILDSPELGISFTNVRAIGAQTKCALTLLVTIGRELTIHCVYDTRRFTESAIQHVLQHIVSMLEYICRSDVLSLEDLVACISPDEIPVVRTPVQQATTDDLIALPQTPLEDILVATWSDILGKQVGIHDDFFALGGHSLLATQLVSRIREIFHIDMSLRTLFEASTIHELSKHILPLLLHDSEAQTKSPPIVAVERTQPIPLSFAQQRLWFMYQLDPANASYNISRPMRIEGVLQLATLQRSIETIVQRHEVLRTTFAEESGQALQVIHPTMPVSLPVVDLRFLPDEQKEAVAHRLIEDIAYQPFDLIKGKLLRVTLLRLEEEVCVLVFVWHHSVFDAWSEGIFMRELVSLYESFAQGLPSPLSLLPIQYADFAVWQRAWLQGTVLKEHIAYWKQHLYGAPELQLPVDFPRSTANVFQGAALRFTLPRSLSDDLRLLSQREGCSLFMLLFAAFQTLLHRYSGQQDIVVGTDIANRHRAEIEPLIGFFVNVLALRAHIQSTMSFRALLRQVRETVLESYVHQDLPFDMLVDALQLKREANQVPLVRALFVFQNIPLSPLHISDLTITPIQFELRTTNFDLALFLWEGEHGLEGGINYRSDLFRSSTIARVAEQFRIILQSIVTQPDASIGTLDIYTPEEKEQQRASARATHVSQRQKLKNIRRDELKLS